MPSTSEMQSLQQSAGPRGSGQARPSAVAAHRDPTAMTATSTTAPSAVVRDPREGQYVFGKRVQRQRASTFKGPGHSIAVKQATDADFVVPPSTIKAAPVNRLRHRSTFGVPAQGKAIRETAVNKDAVKRAMELQPAEVEACTEAIAPVYSSFTSAATVKRAGPSWGRPTKTAFKPFVGDARVKRLEPTEFTTEVHSSIRVSAPRARASSLSASHLGASVSVPRTASISSSEYRAAVARGSSQITDRTSGWLPRGGEDTPGPGQYFIP